jgi:hypothetical protein
MTRHFGAPFLALSFAELIFPNNAMAQMPAAIATPEEALVITLRAESSRPSNGASARHQGAPGRLAIADEVIE